MIVLEAKMCIWKIPFYLLLNLAQLCLQNIFDFDCFFYTLTHQACLEIIWEKLNRCQ